MGISWCSGPNLTQRKILKDAINKNIKIFYQFFCCFCFFLSSSKLRDHRLGEEVFIFLCFIFKFSCPGALSCLLILKIYKIPNKSVIVFWRFARSLNIVHHWYFLSKLYRKEQSITSSGLGCSGIGGASWREWPFEILLNAQRWEREDKNSFLSPVTLPPALLLILFSTVVKYTRQRVTILTTFKRAVR